MTDKILNLINKRYPLTEVSVGDMAKLKANGMTFTISAYKASGLGRVSVMRAKGFFGLMKMDTLIVNPYDIDLPLYSYDRIYAAVNDTLIVELYDTLLGAYAEEDMEKVKAEYQDLAEREPGQHWYDNIKLSSSISKKGKKSQQERFDELTLRHFEAYISGEALPVSDMEAKQKKASYYVDGLLEKGGPSTDVFKKALGMGKTTMLFKKVLFGTDLCQ